MRKELILTIELIPSSSWQSNLRDLLKPKMWEDVRKKVYKSKNYKCAICGQRKKLQAHEIWEFDPKTRTQTLRDIVPLCFMCHMVKHIGFAGIIGNRSMNERLIKHFLDVNGCDRVTFQKHLKAAIRNFEDRSRYEWTLDIKKLKDFE